MALRRMYALADAGVIGGITRGAASAPWEAEMSEAKCGTPRIVAGVDGSPTSIAALRWAVRQAEVSGGLVDAVIAWEFPVAGGSYGWAPIAPFEDTDYRELAARTLNAAVAVVGPPASVAVKQVVVEGNPSQVLLDVAKDADLLVVGNRGHSAFVDALIGSVSVRCLHHAACPVVVVRSAWLPPGADDPEPAAISHGS